jgi:hypothetical protein
MQHILFSFDHSNVFIWSLLSFNTFIKDQLTDSPFFLESSKRAPSLASPYACTGPALYALGGRQALPGQTYALLRANRLYASHLDYRSDWAV